jgi:hypothetical protein
MLCHRGIVMSHSCIDLTDNLYQFDREYNSGRKSPKIANFEVSLRRHIRIFRPASGGVQAERSEFIEEPGRKQAQGDSTSADAYAAATQLSGAGAR